MSSEDELIEQRRHNLEELAKLGVEIYPRSFERRHTVSELVEAHGQRSREDLETDKVETRTTPPIAPPRPTSPATVPTARLGKRSVGRIIINVDHH